MRGKLSIRKARLSKDQVIEYYRGLWNVEQAFRMSKTDLKTRPTFIMSVMPSERTKWQKSEV